MAKKTNGAVATPPSPPPARPGPKLAESAYERFARRFVDAAQAMTEALVELRALIAADEGSDATAVAGYLARAILEEGGSLPGNNPNALRWVINESPPPASDPKAVNATRQLFALVLEALDHGAQDNGNLARAAKLWPDARNRTEADRAMREHMEAEGQAIAEQHRREHEARLAAASIDPMVAARARQARADEHERAVKAERDGRNARMRSRGIEPNDEGEWIEGDAFEIPEGIVPGGVG